jgi:hypothetical protein
MATMKKKISVRDMALGAGAMTVLMIVPAVGDAISKVVASIRNKISGRK